MIKLELTVNEVNIILGSLGKQPFEAVASVINKIQEQGAPQAAALAQAEAAAKQAEGAAE
jgi:hypothetical protein